MTISLKADASGNSGAIQVAGVDRLTLTTGGSLVASANPATGARSMALATMQKFADEFGASLAASGYQKLPSGLMLQWGNITVPIDTNNYTVTFPVAFGAAYQVFVTGTYTGAAGGTSMGDVTAGILSATQFNINNDNYGQNVQWLAIGKA